MWRMQWHLTPVLLPGETYGRRSLGGCSPWDCKESDTTERLHVHFSLACIGEGNGNPLQCSCLENPGDRGAWWAAVYGVAQSRTRLKQFSSSSSTLLCVCGVYMYIYTTSSLSTHLLMKQVAAHLGYCNQCCNEDSVNMSLQTDVFIFLMLKL